MILDCKVNSKYNINDIILFKAYGIPTYGIIKAIELVPVTSNKIKISNDTPINTPITFDELKDTAAMYNCSKVISNTGTFQLQYKVYINTDNWTRLYGKYQPIYIQEKNIISKIDIEEIDKLKNAADKGSTPKHEEKTNDTKIYSIGKIVEFRVKKDGEYKSFIGKIVDRTYIPEDNTHDYKIQLMHSTANETDQLEIYYKIQQLVNSTADETDELGIVTYYYVLEQDIIKEFKD